MTAAPELRPAATVLLVREDGGDLSVYLVKRHGRSGFMAGAHVFPGGRVDEADGALAAALSPALRAAALAMLDGEEDERTAVAFAVAAVRETAEECGVLLAIDEAGDHPSEADAATIAAELRAGRPFGEVLSSRGLLPDVAALRPFAWWVTPAAEPKRYDTRFFLAPAPPHRADVDAQEVTEGEWFTPAAALAAYTAGEIVLAPPTLVTLEDLVGAKTLDDAAACVERPIPAICPVITNDESGMVLALPGDPLHESQTPAFAGRSRIIMTAAGLFESVNARA